MDNARPWINCPFCEDMLCVIHEQHAFECDCLPIDEAESDCPYPTIGDAPNEETE